MSNEPAPSTSDRAPIFEDRSRTFFIVAGCLAVVVMAGWLAFNPMLRQIRVWRASRLVAAGTAALATNNLPAVSRTVRAAVGLAPTDPGVQRLAAYYCARTSQPEGFSYFELLLKSGTATMVDRQEFARFAQGLERLDLSGDLIKELIAEDPQNRTNQLLVLDQFARLGDWARVAQGAAALAQAFPNDSEIQLTLARAYLGTQDPANGKRAIDLLRGLIRDEGPMRLAALRTFASLQGPSEAELRRAATDLERHPQARINDQLLAAEVRERLEPSRRNAIALAVVDSLSGRIDDSELIPLVEWLRARKLYSQALALVPPDRARAAAGLVLARGELLADMKRWDELSTFLKQPKLPLHRVGMACLQAVLAFGTGKTDEASFLLREAAKAAIGNPIFLQQVAVFAQQMGQHALASEIWDGLLRNPATTIPAAAVLLRQARGSDDLEVERKVYKQLIGPLGQQGSVRFQHAYLSALFNEQLADAESALAGLLAKDMTSLPLRAALSLTKLRLGKPAEALTLCETGDADWSAQEPRWRAIYAATLQANGQGAAARRIASRIPVDRLKLPERVLIEAILGH